MTVVCSREVQAFLRRKVTGDDDGTPSGIGEGREGIHGIRGFRAEASDELQSSILAPGLPLRGLGERDQGPTPETTLLHTAPLGTGLEIRVLGRRRRTGRLEEGIFCVFPGREIILGR